MDGSVTNQLATLTMLVQARAPLAGLSELLVELSSLPDDVKAAVVGKLRGQE